jgi:hypothetical protein
MDPLAIIRQEKHKEYRRITWLPTFFEKYKSYFNPQNKYKRILLKFFKKYCLKPTVNDVNAIPGYFRYRIKLDNNNQNKPIINNRVTFTTNSNPMTQYIPLDYMDKHTKRYEAKQQRSMKYIINKKTREDNDSQLDRLLIQSRQEFEDEQILQTIIEQTKQNNDDELIQKIINESKKEYNGNFDEDCDENDDEDDLKKAIQLSLEESFYYCIDLQLYGPNPEMAIKHNDKMYYLNMSQINKVKQVWNDIDPSTGKGMIYRQNFEYVKSLANDMSKIKK